MDPFPNVEDQVQHDRVSDEGPSSTSSGSNGTSASDKLSALPQHSAQSPRVTRFSPPPSTRRQQRLSFDGDLLNFPSLHMSDFEISPLRRLKDKFDSHTSRGTLPRMSASEGNSPHNGRLSVDSDHSKSTPYSGKQILGRRLRIGSDPHLPASHNSPADATDGDTSRSNRHHYSHSPSNSRSRGASPFRFIHTISAGFHHSRPHQPEPEEPFIPINPFKPKLSFDFSLWSGFRTASKQQDIELAESSVNSTTTGGSGAEACNVVLISSIKDCARHSNVFVADVLPRLIYLNILLRLPALYFSRVSRIFRDAEVSRPDIERMIEAGEYWLFPPHIDQLPEGQARSQPHPNHSGPGADDPQGRGGEKSREIRSVVTSGQAPLANAQEPCPPPKATPALRRFKHSWEMFIDSLLREWKTLNVVSALLASAILTIFQIPDAAGDPVTRTAAILSLICALMSLTYGCIYIVRFGTMRSMVRASKWAEEARRTNTAILWNVWVLLAMPAVWLAWSMVIFMVTILSFVWRTGSEADPPDGRPPLSTTAILGPRIAITFVVLIGFTYLILIVRTLKSYGMHGGNSHNMLTSPQTHLGILRPPTPVGPENGGNQDHSRRMEVALERRGRERTRNAQVRNGQRREEGPEIRGGRKEYRVPIQDHLKDGNELGLFPVHSSPSMVQK